MILQPVRVVLGFAMRFLWHPPQITPPRTTGTTWPELAARADQLYQSLDRVKYGQDDDSAKFSGMLAWAYPDREWENFMRLVDDAGNVKRNLRSPYPADSPDFSTDMLSGFMLGVYGNLNRMTDEERERLVRVWEKAGWQGWPMLISSANRGKSLFKRGHIYRFWWIFGSEEILMCLAWLALGYRLTGKFKYSIAYWLMMILLSPSLLLTCPDAQIFIRRVYMLSAHNTHSRALINFVGQQLTNSVWFRRALKTAYKRHGGYNADISLLYFLAADDFADALSRSHELAALVASAASKGESPCPADAKYLELGFPPEINCQSSNFMPPESRGNDYVWERSPLKGYIYNDDARDKLGLDVIFPVELARRIYGWDDGDN